MKKLVVASVALAGAAAAAVIVRRNRQTQVSEAMGGWADAVSETAASAASSVGDVASKAADAVSKAADKLPDEAGDVKAAHRLEQRLARPDAGFEIIVHYVRPGFGSRDRHAAVGDDDLAGDEGRRLGG